MFLLEKWKGAEQNVSSEMEQVSAIYSIANMFKFNMNTNNNDYKMKDEQNNAILMRDYGSSKRSLNPINSSDTNNNINTNKINSNINIRTNNIMQPKKFPFGGRAPFSKNNKDYPEDEDSTNENQDSDMNFKDNAGENFYKKIKSNLEKDLVVSDPPEEKEKSRHYIITR